MRTFRVWASSRSSSCLLFAESETEAIEFIRELKVYGEEPLQAEPDSEVWNFSEDEVVLPTGGAVSKSGRS